MPRIIPRLLDKLSTLPESAKSIISPKRICRRRTMFRAPLEVPAFHPSEHTRSILLDDVNPIVHSQRYRRHKLQPARVKLGRNASTMEADDNLREMTEQERSWWSDPYMRMLSSPLRRCLLTETYLPTDFLIRLSAMKAPGQTVQHPVPPMSIVVPDGLEHPKFRGRKSGRAFYVSCRREALTKLMNKGTYQRFAPRLTMSPGVVMQVAHLLRVRVLQEIQLIADTLSVIRYKARTPILRRLTRHELATIRETGQVQQREALAVLIVPPVNKNPTTDTTPQPFLSTLPPPLVPDKNKPLPPLSIMYSCGEQPDVAHGLPQLPTPQTPLYNGLSLFPHPNQRATFYSALTSILSTQPRIRGHEGSKASHGFLLCSSADTVQAVDVVPLAIALWRLRMFEGSEGRETG